MAFARQPTLFVSHGPPALALWDVPASRFLRELGASLAKPRAIVCVSAHFEAVRPMTTGAEVPSTIHDFGPSPRLQALSYPAPGNPDLAHAVRDLVAARGYDARVEPRRGLDHGCWAPLLLMFPEADIPVVQLSIQAEREPQHHFDLGEAIAPLRDEDVLIMGSGNATHDLDSASDHGRDDPPEDYAEAFDAWLERMVSHGGTDELLDWERLAPEARRNHPWPSEHFLPIFPPLGAAGHGAKGRLLHRSFLYGVLSMAAYIWE
ncbi:MAG: DODA-type extradiol aromatic ring-opening family dioxygenase [Desulfatibacillaceae bacterium]